MAAAVVFTAGAALLLARAGSVSLTWDEQIDVRVVECLQATRNPFRCLDDITQARLPFYLHAAARLATPSPLAQYAVSAAFSLVNLALVFAFARSRFDGRVAVVAAAMSATSPALLASGRMLLSHSSVVLTTFFLATVVAYERYDRAGDRRFFWLSSVVFGLATASSVLGLSVALVIVGFWLFGARRAKPWQPPAYAAVGFAVFLVASVIYLDPQNLRAFVEGPGATSEAYHYWNYLELGTNVAPRWYSLVLFVIKAGPLVAPLFLVAPFLLVRTPHLRPHRRWVLVVWGAFVLYLVVKAGVFRYDAPHQQVQWYPLAFVLAAAAAVEAVRRAGRLRPLVVGVLALLSGLHLYDTARFFPNYAFYGAQYGDRFIGEFYGPAVQHSQDRDEVDAAIDTIVRSDPGVRILMADNNAFDRAGDNFVRFTTRDPAATYEYAIVDRLHGDHFHFPERDAFNAHLAAHYEIIRSHEFPTRKWAYRILRVKQGAAEPAR